MRYEIHALSFAEILDTAFRLLRNHVRLLLGVSAVVYVPLALARHWLTAQTLGDQVADLSSIVVAGVALAVVVLVGVPVVFAALTWAIGEVYVGRTPSAGDAFRAARRHLVALVGTSILYALAVLACFTLLGGLTAALAYLLPDIRIGAAVVGAIVTVVASIGLFLSYLLVWPVMLVEQTFGMRALRRSRELMRGRRWRGLGVTLVAAVLMGVLGGVLQLAVSAIPYLGPVAVGIAEALAMAYQTAVTNLLYFDARSRREAFDVEHLATQVAARGVATA